ncbi:MAG: hypothetical protein K6L80_03435 [Agarilytica sp.]
MKSLIKSCWNLVMDNRYNPLRYMDMASQHYFMHVLAWMWSMIFSISFLSIFHFQFVWLAHVLVITGIFITLIVFKRAEKQSLQKITIPELSHASVCVWQLDREA